MPKQYPGATSCLTGHCDVIYYPQSFKFQTVELHNMEQETATNVGYAEEISSLIQKSYDVDYYRQAFHDYKVSDEVQKGESALWNYFHNSLEELQKKVKMIGRKRIQVDSKSGYDDSIVVRLIYGRYTC